jgi:hypothetical protein
MGSHYAPRHYVVSHFLIGFAASYYPVIGILALIYQLGQYYFNVRVFPVEGKIIQGNSAHVTSIKLTEITVGYLIGSLVQLRNKT